MGSPGEDAPRKDDPAASPDLLEALREIGVTGHASLSAVGDTAKALRSLAAADLSLARSAVGRTLAMSGIAVVCGATTWLFLMGTLVVFLNRTVGLPWAMALLIPAVLSLTATCLAVWGAVRYFGHTRMDATRRQFARLGASELSELIRSLAAKEKSGHADAPDSRARDSEAS